MTEKYFKYLMKQSLPLFALILAFGLLFSLGFINPDNLPAYLAIVSLAIPFLFQFWQFRRSFFCSRWSFARASLLPR